MPLNNKELREQAEQILLDPHFELRLKNRHINIHEIRECLKDKIPIIKEIGENKYKIAYQIEKSRYLSIYLVNDTKGLKMITVFIERRIKWTN